MASDIWLRTILKVRKETRCHMGYSFRITARVLLYAPGSKEGNVLFNDALNTFYLRLYGVRHMVKDHSDSEKGNPLPPHRLLFPINSKGSFICTIPQRGLHIPQPLLHQSWRNRSLGPPHEGSIWRPIAPWANALTTELHLAPVLLYYNK